MSVEAKTAPVLGTPDLICYAVHPDAPKIVPARAERDWMDATNDRFAYRCTPLSIANASGWEILSPFTFEAWWHGGNLEADVSFIPRGGRKIDHFVSSHFGHGVLTFHTGYVFRTSPGWALLARGSPNTAKARIAPLEGIIETDWLPFTFTMNWRFTRMGTVRFEEGEPFCFITPVPHAMLDAVQPVIRDVSSDPDLAAAVKGWGDSRADFNARLSRLDPEAVAEGWQRTYVRGENPHGKSPEFHLSKRRMKAPRSDRT